MRTIKFRALKDDMSNYNFVYGNLIYDNEGNPRIQDGKSMLFHTCIKETVGQFTGLTDKNGEEIYEGDKMLYIDIDKCYYNGNVTFELGGFYIDGNIGEFTIEGYCHEMEVIGNIHENR